jgi:hypothetical protein
VPLSRSVSRCLIESEPWNLGSPFLGKEENMGLGVGILLAAAGAVLAFAVHTSVNGVNIHTVGWILLIVGIAAVVLSMIFWSSWAGPGYWTRQRSDYSEAPPPPY